MSDRPGTGARAILWVIRIYRAGISPLLGPRCRFEPSCSAYAATAVSRFGALRGSWLAAARVARCHPFHPGGYDPVPEPGPGPRVVRHPVVPDPHDPQ